MRWDEAGTIFCASVINANEGAGVYDLRYDHLIDGKLCEEVNVSPSRLSTLQEAENYWDESCEEPVHSSATKDGKKSSLLHTSQLANNIVKVVLLVLLSSVSIIILLCSRRKV